MNHNLSSLKKIIKLNKVILQSRKGGQDKKLCFFLNKFNGLRFQICHSVEIKKCMNFRQIPDKQFGMLPNLE